METRYPNPISPTATRIGWIGIGLMGSAMATRLLYAGYSLTVYARTPSKALKLQSLGARLVDSPSQLARECDVVFTMIGHPSDIIQAAIRSSHQSSEIYETVRFKDCWSVDAPVSGGDIGAMNGTLAILAGGDEQVVQWLSPLFDLLGRATYMGKAGCGQSCKIANQITVGGNLLGLSEGLLFAKKAGGLDLVQWMESVKEGAAGSMVMELFGRRMVSRDFEAGGFAEYMVKDLGMASGGGDEEGGDAVVLPGAALCKALFSGMVANGDGKLGTQGLVSVLEKLNGSQI
ncbi:unnamed protein product [Rhodiola kirilowii]